MKKRRQRTSSALKGPQKASLGSAFNLFWGNYFRFRGTSSRSEFWWWYVWQALFALIGLAMLMTLGKSITTFITIVYAIVTFIPNMTLTIRRMRDAGCANAVIAFIVTIFYVLAPFSPATFIVAEEAAIFGLGIVTVACFPSHDR